MTGPWVAAVVAIGLLSVGSAIGLLALARYISALVARFPQPLPLELGEGPELGTKLADSPLAATALPLRSNGALLLSFLSTECSACTALVSDLNRFARDHREMAVYATVSGTGPAASGLIEALVHASTIADPDAVWAKAFEVKTVPFALMYRDGHLLAKGVANSRDMLESLANGQVKRLDEDVVSSIAEALAVDRSPTNGG